MRVPTIIIDNVMHKAPANVIIIPVKEFHPLIS
jgi:hypothetical protein